MYLIMTNDEITERRNDFKEKIINQIQPNTEYDYLGLAKLCDVEMKEVIASYRDENDFGSAFLQLMRENVIPLKSGKIVKNEK